MKDYRAEYYEQSSIWEHDYLENPAERMKIAEVINTIPNDVHSLLDVGCGNGAFINTLAEKFDRIVGLDPCEEALRYVKTEKFRGDISKLPFEDKSFDMVTSLEVLEHLSLEDFKDGIAELQRVSNKYILVTVPNKENLKYSQITCPKCYCRFNPCFHLRSFNENILQTLLADFRIAQTREVGPVRYHYHPFWLNIYRAAVKLQPGKTTICPQCGFHDKLEISKSQAKGNAVYALCKKIPLTGHLKRLLFATKKKRWLLAMYERA